MQELETSLRANVPDEPQFSAFTRAVVEKPKGVHTFHGIKLTMGGSMTNALKRIRDGFLEEMSARFANRPILAKFGWLDVSKWPVDATLQSYGVQDLQAVFEHWKRRFPSMTWEAVLQEFDQMKVVYKTALKPVDSRAFLKHIICSRTLFPCMHLLLRCAFALAPGDAVVEQAFSRLTRLLAPQRLRIKPRLVEQNLIMALDSIPWTEYNFAPVWEIVSTNVRRARFRVARSDRGSKKKKETRKRAKGEEAEALRCHSHRCFRQ